MQWLIASRSHGKLAKLVPMLAEHGIVAIGLDAAGVVLNTAEDDIECFDSFEANALAKARYFAALTGLPCVADDSGLCVEALDQGPGVRSRRFASDRGVATLGGSVDEANNLAMLDACWDSGRAPPWTAHFACAAAYVDATRTCVAAGRTDGAIIPAPDGVGGFGYDPYFMSADLSVTFALASREAKSRVSHRGRAFANLLALLRRAQSATSAR